MRATGRPIRAMPPPRRGDTRHRHPGRTHARHRRSGQRGIVSARSTIVRVPQTIAPERPMSAPEQPRNVPGPPTTALKQVNDTDGHLAGDSLLLAVADSLRGCLRSYDLIMRFGGDELVCALPNADVKRVRQRFTDVSNALAAGPTKGSITVGFAKLGENDSAEDLIRRADADLLAHRDRA